LLKEIHHRVKNNLQIISSLLYLQSQHIEDKASRATFLEGRGRVKSMALVHEKLYQSEDLARIDFQEYLMSFTNYLMQSYHSDHKRIHLDLNVDKVHIPVDSAIPCSLIINELITNALKYAFEGREQGTLSLTLHENESNIQVVVSDNGVGMPEGYNIQESETLGMQLIVGLVQQLRGTLETDFTDGTTFTFNFSCDCY